MSQAAPEGALSSLSWTFTTSTATSTTSRATTLTAVLSARPLHRQPTLEFCRKGGFSRSPFPPVIVHSFCQMIIVFRTLIQRSSQKTTKHSKVFSPPESFVLKVKDCVGSHLYERLVLGPTVSFALDPTNFPLSSSLHDTIILATCQNTTQSSSTRGI